MEQYEKIKAYIDKCMVNEATLLVVNVYDGVHVDIFKTKEIRVHENWIRVVSWDDCVGFGIHSVELTNYGFVSNWSEDGHSYETRVYNLKWTRNLELANEFIKSIIDDIERMKRELEKSYNLLHFEWYDRYMKR